MTNDVQAINHENGSRVAYRNSSALTSKTQSPVVLFLGGFYSNMDGSKAQYLHRYCEDARIAFIRFDYRGHGRSDGAFTEFGISDWIDDAALVATMAQDRPLIVLGSSMGGWIGARLPHRQVAISAYIGIAAAPDFTEEGFWAGFSTAEREMIARDEIVYVPSGYPDPYPIGAKLINQGREERVFTQELRFGCPVHLLYGQHDSAVNIETTQRYFDHIADADTVLEIVKSADHGFSRKDDLARLSRRVQHVVDELSKN